jgi:predicted phage terminase large subunit-like protein
VQDIPQDPGQAGKAQVRSFVSYLPEFDVKYSTESGDKVLRAEPFSAQCEAGNVKLVKGKWNHDYLDEIGYFPNGFKDQVDATTRAYNRVIKLARLNSGTVGGCAGVKQNQ